MEDPPLIDGYVVTAMLGRGGMGVVWSARELTLDRVVAIKVLRRSLPDPAVRELLVERLKREAKAAARIDSPHTARILQLGETRDGDPLIVMEYVDGRPLKGDIAHGPFPPERAVAIARQICAGMIEAHAHGVIHRDLKPSNILLCAKNGSHDFVKILDFGVARVVDEPGLTAAGAIVGTFDYMAPEQLAGEELDGRADIYTLGLLLYEMLTGARLFSRDRAADRAARERPFSWALAPKRERMPSGLADVVTRCLAPDRAQRFASMRDVDAALAASLATPLVDVGPRDVATVKMYVETELDETVLHPPTSGAKSCASDQGAVDVVLVAPGIVVVTVTGVADDRIGRFIRETAEMLWAESVAPSPRSAPSSSSIAPSSSAAPSGRLKAYFDLTGMTGFRSAFRKAMYTWQAEARGRTEQVVLVRSRIVATIIQQATRLLGGGAAVTANREHWQRVLDLEVKSRSGIDASSR